MARFILSIVLTSLVLSGCNQSPPPPPPDGKNQAPKIEAEASIELKSSSKSVSKTTTMKIGEVDEEEDLDESMKNESVSN